MKRNLTKGIFFAFVASVISGIAIFYSKISVTKIDPLILTTSRNIMAGMLFVICYLLFGKKEELRKINKSNFVKLLIIGIFGGGISFYLFFTGLKLVDSAITANLIQKTLFIWVGLLAGITLKEKLNWKYWLSFILIIFGNFYFAKLPFHLGRGELMILAATLLWSVENIIAKKVLKNLSSELIGLFRMGIGSLFLLLSVLATGKFSNLLTISNQQLAIILLGGSILFFYVFFWFKALKYSPVSLAVLVLTFATVVGNVLNGSFAGIKILPVDIFSSIFIIISTLIIFFGQPIPTASVRKGWRRQAKIDE